MRGSPPRGVTASTSTMGPMRLLLLLLVGGGLGCNLFSGAEDQPQSLRDWGLAAQRADMTGGTASPPMVSPGWSFTGAQSWPGDPQRAILLPSGKVLLTHFVCQLYDPATGEWEITSQLYDYRYLNTLTLLLSGKVIMIGGARSDGFGGVESTAITAVYDPAEDYWVRTSSLFSPRYYHTATLLPSGKVLVVGGYDALFPSVEVYDPATHAWSYADSTAQPRAEHTATLLHSGKVLVVGGWYASDKAELYDPATEEWTPTGSPGASRFRHTATLLPSGKVLVTGGEGSWHSAELYDPATGEWSPTSPMAKARSSHTATLLPSGKVLVAGGDLLGSSEVYDPATGTWSPAAPMATVRNFHTATLLPSGNVLVSGDHRRAEVYSMLIVVAPAYDSATSNTTPDYRGVGEAGSTVTLTVDGSLVGSTTVDAEGSWNLTSGLVLVEGPHLVQATATDAAGNTTAQSSPNLFRIDTTPPGAPVLEAPANGSAIADNTPTCSGRAEAGITVTVIVDDVPVGSTTADAEGGWSLTATLLLTDGPRTLRATASDAVGNVSPTPLTRRFTVDTVPPEAPELSVPETYNTQKPVIAGAAEPHSTITIWLDGIEIGTTTVTVTGLWVFSPDTELLEGPHLVKATARDTVGNVSSDSAEFRFTIVLIKRSHYGWNCAMSPAIPATWALLPLALSLRRRRSNAS